MTLFHESYHVGCNHWTDNDGRAYQYGIDMAGKLMPCIRRFYPVSGGAH